MAKACDQECYNVVDYFYPMWSDKRKNELAAQVQQLIEDSGENVEDDE
jgi:hypothetical protein